MRNEFFVEFKAASICALIIVSASSAFGSGIIKSENVDTVQLQNSISAQLPAALNQKLNGQFAVKSDEISYSFSYSWFDPLTAGLNFRGRIRESTLLYKNIEFDVAETEKTQPNSFKVSCVLKLQQDIHSLEKNKCRIKLDHCDIFPENQTLRNAIGKYRSEEPINCLSDQDYDDYRSQHGD